MKATLIIIGLVLVNLANGQDSTSRFHVGIKHGVGMALYDDVPKYKMSEYSGLQHLTYMLGIYSEFRIISTLTTGFEAIFHARGGSFKRDNPDVEIMNFFGPDENAYDEFRYYTNSFDFPLYLKLHPFNWKARPYFKAGVSPGVIVESSYQYNIYTVKGIYDVEEENETERYGEIKGTFSLGYIFGLGIDFHRFIFEFRYSKFPKDIIMVDGLKETATNHAYGISVSININK